MAAKLLRLITFALFTASATKARQCYQGTPGSTQTVECQNDWCVKLIPYGGKTASFRCDTFGGCPSFGNKCQRDQNVDTTCCCDTDLCNTPTPVSCYDGQMGSTDVVDCFFDWCLQTVPEYFADKVLYSCDDTLICQGRSEARECIYSPSGSSSCCCNTSLCNDPSKTPKIQCYSGSKSGTVSTIDCYQGWCATATLDGDDDVHYSCDGTCVAAGNGCKKVDHATKCCCDSNLCNGEGGMTTQPTTNNGAGTTSCSDSGQCNAGYVVDRNTFLGFMMLIVVRYGISDHL